MSLRLAWNVTCNVSKTAIRCVCVTHCTRLLFYPGLQTPLSFCLGSWREEYNIKWNICILSTKFGEWSIFNKVRPSSINKLCRHTYNNGHKTPPRAHQQKITVEELIKKSFQRPHDFTEHNGQPCLPALHVWLSLWPECFPHLFMLHLPPPNRPRACEPSWSRSG